VNNGHGQCAALDRYLQTWKFPSSTAVIHLEMYESRRNSGAFMPICLRWWHTSRELLPSGLQSSAEQEDLHMHIPKIKKWGGRSIKYAF
jgi:hypothetical protein